MKHAQSPGRVIFAGEQNRGVHQGRAQTRGALRHLSCEPGCGGGRAAAAAAACDRAQNCGRGPPAAAAAHTGYTKSQGVAGWRRSVKSRRVRRPDTQVSQQGSGVKGLDRTQHCAARSRHGTQVSGQARRARSTTRRRPHGQAAGAAGCAIGNPSRHSPPAAGKRGGQLGAREGVARRGCGRAAPGPAAPCH